MEISTKFSTCPIQTTGHVTGILVSTDDYYVLS